MKTRAHLAALLACAPAILPALACGGGDTDPGTGGQATTSSSSSTSSGGGGGAGGSTGTTSTTGTGGAPQKIDHRWSRRFGDDGPQLGNAVAVGHKGDVFLGGFFGGTIDFGAGQSAMAGAPGEIAAFLAQLDAQGATQKGWGFGSAPAPAFNYTQVSAIGPAPAGGVVVGGNFLASLDLGSVHLTAQSPQDAFAIAIGADGTPAWAHAFVGKSQGFAAVTSVAVDAMGEVAVAGYFSGTVDFGGVTASTASTMFPDLFVVKLSAAGDLVWLRHFGPGPNGGVVAIQPDDTIVLAAASPGAIDFGGGPKPVFGGFDIHVAAFSSADGGTLWSKVFGGPGVMDMPSSLTAAADGSLLLAGTFQGNAAFGNVTLTSAGESSAFVVRLDAAGTPTMGLGLGAGDAVGGRAVSDAAGDIVVAGSFATAFSIGSIDVPAPGGQAVFVAKLAADGAPIAAASYGAMDAQVAIAGVAVNGDGQVIVAGSVEGAIDFGGGALPQGGGKDVFVAALDP